MQRCLFGAGGFLGDDACDTEGPGSSQDKTAVSSVHQIRASPSSQTVFDRLILIVNEGLSWPISCDVDTGTWIENLKEQEDEVVNDGA